MAKRRFSRKQMVPIRLDHHLVRELDILALKQSRYRSELIREALNDFIRKEKTLEKSMAVRVGS